MPGVFLDKASTDRADIDFSPLQNSLLFPGREFNQSGGLNAKPRPYGIHLCSDRLEPPGNR